MPENPFINYLDNTSIFKKDRDILRASYIPDELPHRDSQINAIAQILYPSLKGQRASNLMIFGKTGTGKTAVAKYMKKEIEEAIEMAKLDIDLHYIYINCEISDTNYGVLQNIGNRFIKDFDSRIPHTGLSKERVYNMLFENLDDKKRVVIVVLDELDKLVYKSGDDVLYDLLKINDELKNSKVSLIGISNDLKFSELLDTRVKSRFGEEKMVFPPYNAGQLKDILKQRTEIAFAEDVIDDSVLGLCAALAAREHGDARRALDLLRVAAELAERGHEPRITEKHVKAAKNQIEMDCVSEAIRTLPQHSKLILMGIIMNEMRGRGSLTTGELYTIYVDLSRKSGNTPLTQRRITDLISELDMLGIIRASVVSFGRGGRTKKIESAVPPESTRDLLLADPQLEILKDYRIKVQKTLSI